MHADSRAVIDDLPEHALLAAMRCRSDCARMLDDAMRAIGKGDFDAANRVGWQFERRIHRAIIESQQEGLRNGMLR